MEQFAWYIVPPSLTPIFIYFLIFPADLLNWSHRYLYSYPVDHPRWVFPSCLSVCGSLVSLQIPVQTNGNRHSIHVPGWKNSIDDSFHSLIKSSIFKMMFAALPPSSSVYFSLFRRLLFCMIFPTSVDPVNAILSISGCFTNAAPVAPAPVTIFTTPGGRSASEWSRLISTRWVVLFPQVSIRQYFLPQAQELFSMQP